VIELDALILMSLRMKADVGKDEPAFPVSSKMKVFLRREEAGTDSANGTTRIEASNFDERISGLRLILKIAGMVKSASKMQRMRCCQITHHAATELIKADCSRYGSRTNYYPGGVKNQVLNWNLHMSG